MSNTASRLTNVLLGGVLALLAVDRTAPVVRAAEAGSGDYFALTAPGQGQGNNVLFVIDPKTERLMVYEHRAGGRLELVTVRSMEFDNDWIMWPKEGAKATVPAVEKPK